jgi:hypothetical protein
MTPEMKSELESRLAEKKKLADELWVELLKIEEEVKPHVDRYEGARKMWCSAYTDANALSELVKSL